MNHKRHRPKVQRAGCIMCKPWKAGLAAPFRPSERRVLQGTAEQLSRDDDYQGAAEAIFRENEQELDAECDAEYDDDYSEEMHALRWYSPPSATQSGWLRKSSPVYQERP